MTRIATVISQLALSMLLAACTFDVAPMATDPGIAPDETQQASNQSLAEESSIATEVQDMEVSQFELADECFVVPDERFSSECGYVAVPEFHDVNSDRALKLAVIRFTAENEMPGTPLFFAAGGPGGSTTNNAMDLSYYESILEDRDIVFFDQRGTGNSVPFLNCPEQSDARLQALTQQLTASERRIAINAATEACFNRHAADGVDVTAYNSIENAADVNAIRAALGYDAIFYHGGSYGTILGQHLMRDYPEMLEGMVLDGSVSLDSWQSWTDDNARKLDNALNAVFAACAVDETCNAAYPDPAGTLNEVLASLANEPATVNTENGDLIMDDVALSRFINTALAVPFLRTFVPQIIYQAAAGDYSNPFLGLFLPFDAQTDEMAVLMHYAVACAEDPVFSVLDMTDFPGNITNDAAMLWALDDAEDYVFACALLDVPVLPSSARAAINSNLPTLFLNGALDPATPIYSSEALAALLPNSFSYTFPAGSHVQIAPTGAPCAKEIMEQFLADPKTAPDGSCIEAEPLASFALPD